MKKYLELFKEGFDSTITEKVKVENWPFVGYDPIQDSVRYTEIQKPMIGPEDNEIWYTSSNDSIVTPSEYADSAFVASIKSNTYDNGKGIITFDGSVTSIRERAFEYCTSLTSITIPNSVTSIGSHAFQNCSSLTYITIPNGVTSIGQSAFYGCVFTSITIPNSVTYIGDFAFARCTKLTSITFQGTKEEWNAISKGVSWKTGVPATHVQCSDGQVAL